MMVVIRITPLFNIFALFLIITAFSISKATTLNHHEKIRKLTEEQHITFEHVDKASVSFQNDIGNTIINLGRPSPFDQHTVIFAIQPLTYNNNNNNDYSIDQTLDTILNEISNPNHINYGRYLTNDQIHNLTINHHSINYVEKYMKSLGLGLHIRRLTKKGDYLTITGPIWSLDYILQTEFMLLKNPKPIRYHASTIQTYRCLTYSLPKDLIGHVKYVFHTIQHPFASYSVRQHPITKHPISAAEPDFWSQSLSQQAATLSTTTSSPINPTTPSTPISEHKHRHNPKKPPSSSYSDDYTNDDYTTDDHSSTRRQYSLGGYMHPYLLRHHYDIFSGHGTSTSPGQGVYSSIGK